MFATGTFASATAEGERRARPPAADRPGRGAAEAGAVRGAERAAVAGEEPDRPRPSPPPAARPAGLTCSAPWKQILQMGWWCWCWCPARWSPPPLLLLLLRLLHTERVSGWSLEPRRSPSPPAPASGSPGLPFPAAVSGTAASGRRLGPSPESPAADTSWPAGGRGRGGGGGWSAPLRRGTTPAGGSAGFAGSSGDAGGAGSGGR